MKRFIIFLLILMALAPALAVAAGRDIAWIKTFGSSLEGEAATAVDADNRGNVYVAGVMPGDGPRAFLRKFAPGGRVIWSRRFEAGGTNYTVADVIALDKKRGAVYVAGTTSGALPGKRSSGGYDAFLRKYKTNGLLVWTRQFGSSGDEGDLGLAVDENGRIYIAGGTTGALRGERSAGGVDAFIRRYSRSGRLQWTRQFGNAGDQRAVSVAVGSGGQVFLLGETSRALKGQDANGGTDIFLRKYRAGGALRWTRQFGSDQNDYASTVRVGPGNTIFISGQTYGSLSGSDRSVNLDGFLQKRGPRGGLAWSKQFAIMPELASIVGLAVDIRGNAYVSGSISSGGRSKAFARRYGSGGSSKWTRQILSGRGFAAVTNDQGNLYVVGMTKGALFPRAGHQGNVGDAFVAKFRR